MLKEKFEKLLAETLGAVQSHYRERLVTLAVFGSVARRTQRPDSDIDLLLICEKLPPGRMRRVKEFEKVDRRLAPLLLALNREGISTFLSATFKTPAEVKRGSLFYLDLVDDARLLYDRDDFFKNFLNGLRRRLSELGARRIWRGNSWYWDLKPDFKAGDVIEL